MSVTRGKTILYVDDTITKTVAADVNATSFAVQFIWMSTSNSKIIKSKHIDTVHVYKSEQDFVSKYDIKTQPPLFKTVQFKKINYAGVGHIYMQSKTALGEPSLDSYSFTLSLR